MLSPTRHRIPWNRIVPWSRLFQIAERDRVICCYLVWTLITQCDMNDYFYAGVSDHFDYFLMGTSMASLVAFPVQEKVNMEIQDDLLDPARNSPWPWWSALSRKGEKQHSSPWGLLFHTHLHSVSVLMGRFKLWIERESRDGALSPRRSSRPLWNVAHTSPGGTEFQEGREQTGFSKPIWMNSVTCSAVCFRIIYVLRKKKKEEKKKHS